MTDNDSQNPETENNSETTKPVEKETPAPAAQTRVPVIFPYDSRSDKQRLVFTAATFGLSAWYAMHKQPHVFSPDLTGVATTATFGLFMDTGREMLMLVGRMVGSKAPSWASKITTDPALYLGLALSTLVVFPAFRDNALEVAKVAKPALAWYGNAIIEETTHLKDNKSHHHFHFDW